MPATTVPNAVSTPTLDAHLAVPPIGRGPWPGVVVLHESLGLNNDIRDHADRLAAAGYLAVAPDLFTGRGRLRCLRATFAALAAGDGPVFGDIKAVRRWLSGRSDCTGRVGVIGFCLGGGFALLTANQGFDVSAPNYARLPRDPVTVLRGACPIVASYGRRDPALRGSAATLTAALGTAGVEFDVREYPGAGHSFLNRHNTGPLAVVERVAGLGYHHPSAEDAWGRILRFFDRHLTT